MSKMNQSTERAQLRHSQAGIVSIMVTMILMIVITLIVLGFAQIARRTQRESLDEQLSTQAFYAAESGVNDARSLLETAVTAGNPIYAKTDCVNTSGSPGDPLVALNSTVNAANNVKYSCLLVDPAPTTLRFGDVGKSSTIVPFISSNGDNFSTITLTWQAKNNITPITNCPTTAPDQFTDTAGWVCGYGVLRFDLVPTQGNSLSASGLADSTMTTFAVPLSSGGTNTASYPAGTPASVQNANKLVGVHCDNSQCQLTINGLSKNQYFMRVSSIYNNASLQVTAKNAAGTDIKLSGAQAQIDATGKAQDVLRRILVNVPLRASNSNALPDYALESTDSICKRFAVMDGYYSVPDLDAVTGDNALCQLDP